MDESTMTVTPESVDAAINGHTLALPRPETPDPKKAAERVAKQKAAKAKPQKKAPDGLHVRPKGRKEEIELADIDLRNAIQMRARINPGMVERFEDLYGEDRRPDRLERIRVFRDPETKVNRITDGVQRVTAAKNVGMKSIAAEVVDAGLTEAMLDAAGANQGHLGSPRSRADIQNTLRRTLAMPELKGKSALYLQSVTGISDKTITKFRKAMAAAAGEEKPRTVENEGGKTVPASLSEKAIEARVEKNRATRQEEAMAKAEAWLKTVEFRARLPKVKREGFDNGAKAWHMFVNLPSYPAFRKEVAGILRELDTDRRNVILRLIRGPFHMKSPADATLCAACHGTGAKHVDDKPTDKICPKCNGGGFVL